MGNYYYGHGHPMKPQRIRMAHSLILNYGMLRLMECYVKLKKGQNNINIETKNCNI